MKHYVYLMEGSEKKLIYMEEQDHSGMVVYSIDHQTNPPLEKRMKYFDLLMLEETDIEDGAEIGKLVFEYDYQNRVVSQKRYTQEFLVEEIYTQYIDNTTVTSRVENGIVIERSIEKEYDDGTRTTEFYDFGEMFEIQQESYNFEANTYVTRVMNVNQELISTILEHVDDHNRLLSNREIGADGKPISEHIYTIKNDQLIQADFKDHTKGTHEIHRYTYDGSGNEIEIRIEDVMGTTKGFHATMYNENGTVTEEKGIRGGDFNFSTPVYLHPATREYYLLHEYVE